MEGSCGVWYGSGGTEITNQVMGGNESSGAGVQQNGKL